MAVGGPSHALEAHLVTRQFCPTLSVLMEPCNTVAQYCTCTIEKVKIFRLFQINLKKTQKSILYIGYPLYCTLDLVSLHHMMQCVAIIITGGDLLSAWMYISVIILKWNRNTVSQLNMGKCKILQQSSCT